MRYVRSWALCRTGSFAREARSHKVRSSAVRIRRYGARSAWGCRRCVDTPGDLARHLRATYVAGSIHRWDLRRPSPGSRLLRRCLMTTTTPTPGPFPCSPSAALTSRPSPATWRRRAGSGPPSPGGCAPSPGSTNTLSRRSSLSTPRPPRPAPPAGLRVARHRPGPQRARRHPGRRRTRPACRARPDLAAGAERAAGLRGHRR